MAGLKGVSIRGDRGRKKGNTFHWSALCAFRILYHVCLLFHARSANYVHETEEIYTATQLNLAKLTKEPSATYQIRLWSQRGTEVNRPHHGDILLRLPWFGNRYDKFKLTRETPSAVHTQPEEHNERTDHTAV